MTKLTKILNIVLYVLLAITLVFAGMFYFGGEEVGAALTTPIYTDSYLNWGKLLVVVAVGVTVIFEVLHLIFNARNAVRTFISIGVLLVVALIGYGMADGTPMEIIGYNGPDNVPSILRMAGTILYGTYILLGGVVVAILYSELSRMFK